MEVGEMKIYLVTRSFRLREISDIITALIVKKYEKSSKLFCVTKWRSAVAIQIHLGH